MNRWKHYFAAVVMIIAFSCSDAQNKRENTNTSDGETKAQETFKSKYPDAKDIDWSTDSNGYYEASFKLNDKKYRADFKEDGSWLETEQSIKYDELPKAVKQVIESEYDKDDIAEIEEVDHYRDGKFFDIEFKQKGKNKDVQITSAGKVIPGS